MQSSDRKFLTTHVGSLPNLVALDEAAAGYDAALRDAVNQVISKQRAIGLDIVNEGEYTKGGDWLSFVESRFKGFEARDWPEGEKPLLARGKDREDFAAYYQYATEKGILFYNPGDQIQCGFSGE